MTSPRGNLSLMPLSGMKRNIFQWMYTRKLLNWVSLVSMLTLSMEVAALEDLKLH